MISVKQKKAVGDPAFSILNKLTRLLWNFVYNLFFRFSPIPFFSYRCWLLTLFGAKLGKNVNIYPSVKIWLPANLNISNGSSLGPFTTIYNQGYITIGSNSIISQGSHLCASTHNYNDPVHPLELAPISIGDNVWICADSFIGPNVTIANGAVIGARAVQVKDAKSWSVYAGNPSVKVKERARFE